MTESSETAADARPGHHRWSRPDLRVAALSLGLGVAVAAVHAVFLSHHAPSLGHDVVPLWMLALMFTATEGFAVHVRVRRGGHAVSLGDIPMALALVGTDPVLLVVSRVVGGGAGLFVLRRQRGLKFGFNLANLAAQATTAIVVFPAVAGDATALGPRTWFAVYAALVATDVLSTVLVTAAIALHDDPGEWRQLPTALRGTPLVVFTASVGLISALAIEFDERAIVLLATVTLVTSLALRAYLRQSQGHAQVEALYTFTQAISGSLDSREVIETALGQFRDQLRAEVAELISPWEGRFVRLRVHGQDDLETVYFDQFPSDAWWSPAVHGRAVLVPRGAADPGGTGERPEPDGMAVPVVYSNGASGVMIVSQSLADLPTFGAEQIRLFQALANHAGIALAQAYLVQELRREVADKEHLALHDQLTGLPNRQQFTGLVAAAVEGPGPDVDTVAVILIDLDRFKEVNDALGHDTGDAMLREVGARLRRDLGARGVVARLGGDEFGVLLPRVTSRAVAIALAEELADSVEHPVPVGGLSLNTRASVGIALAPDHGRDAIALLRRADVAMYAAKDTRTGVRVYQPTDDQNTPRRLALIADLREAIQRRDLTVYFQPKVDGVTGLVAGAEALTRWHHPEHGLIPPDEFIPLAEYSGLIRSLTLGVLEVSLRRCAAWRRAGNDMHVAVNLSPNSLLDTTLPEIVSRLLGQCGVPASALVLEITESSIIADPIGSVATLDRLHVLGVKIAIDDFGTGYSSLGRLRELPIHEMKIDKSFVQRVIIDHRDRAVVRSAIQLGHALDLTVVAEGVEDAATYAHLVQEGCNLIQGYHVSRPLPADEFADWLAAHEPTPDPSRGRPTGDNVRRLRFPA